MVTMGVLDATTKLEELRRILRPFGLLASSTETESSSRKEELEQCLQRVGLTSSQKFWPWQDHYDWQTWGDFLCQYQKVMYRFWPLVVDDLFVICMAEACVNLVKMHQDSIGLMLEDVDHEELLQRRKGKEFTISSEELIEAWTHFVSRSTHAKAINGKMEEYMEQLSQYLATMEKRDVSLDVKLSHFLGLVESNPVVKGLFKYACLKSKFQLSAKEIDELVADRNQWTGVANFLQ